MMLEARALFYAMVLSILIAMISGLLIGLSYLQRLQQIDQVEQQRAKKNVKSGISLLRQESRSVLPEVIDLYGDQQDSVLIGRYPWGLYSVAYAAATYPFLSGKDTISRAFFLGEERDTHFHASLYLMDNNTPLAVVGNTKIKGPVFLPKAGVKRGYLSGEGYTGAELIYGEIQESRKSLPAIADHRIEALYTFFDRGDWGYFSGMNIHQSYLDSTVYLGGEDLVLSDISLQGNVIIIAQSSILISQSADLENVLLFAPSITFEPGFVGQVQAFATEKLIVGEGSHLAYPSVLGLLPDNLSEERKLLDIKEGSDVNGMVLLYQKGASRKEPMVKIREGALVQGQVWAEGYVDLNGGTVHGNLVCKAFWLSTGSSTYTNHVRNGVIDLGARSEDWVNPILAENVKSGAIVQWVK